MLHHRWIVGLGIMCLWCSACGEPHGDASATVAEEETHTPSENTQDASVVTLAPEVQLVEHLPGFISVEVSGEEVQLEFEDNTSPPIDIGSIIVGERSGGYLRRVMSVTRAEETTLILLTEPASLTDAIVEGVIHISATESTESMTRSQGLVHQPLSETISADLAETFIDEGGLRLASTGSASMTVSMEFEIDIKEARVQHLVAISEIQSTLDYNLEASATAGLSVQEELAVPVAKLPFRILVPTPLGIPMPIVGALELDVVMSASAQVEAVGSLTTGFLTSASVQTTLTYDGEAWSRASTPSLDAPTAQPLTWAFEANASLSTSIEPRLSLDLYGVGGPKAGLTRTLSFESTWRPCPPTYSLKAEANDYVELDVHLFEHGITHTFASNEREYTLDEGEFDDPLCEEDQLCGDTKCAEGQECLVLKFRDLSDDIVKDTPLCYPIGYHVCEGETVINGRIETISNVCNAEERCVTRAHRLPIPHKVFECIGEGGFLCDVEPNSQTICYAPQKCCKRFARDESNQCLFPDDCSM